MKYIPLTQNKYTIVDMEIAIIIPTTTTTTLQTPQWEELIVFIIRLLSHIITTSSPLLRKRNLHSRPKKATFCSTLSNSLTILIIKLKKRVPIITIIGVIYVGNNNIYQ